MIIVEWLARIILALMVGLSIWSVSIILDRRKYFKHLDANKDFKDIESEASQFDASFVNEGLSPKLYEMKSRNEKGFIVLGTLGSTTPFIGLLGTILGIIVAFGELSQGNGDTNAIMFALAEALILTAVGLFVAIPATISFNYFNKRSRQYFNQLQSLIDNYCARRK